MTISNSNHEDRRLRRKTAAFRLKHDVGKALRWSAPDERETREEDLRARLVRDLLPRASGGGANRNVVELFFEWKREEGPLFSAGDADLEAVERAMTRVATLVPSLSSSSADSVLIALDDACLEAARACTAFYRRIALDEGSETVRPVGGRQ